MNEINFSCEISDEGQTPKRISSWQKSCMGLHFLKALLSDIGTADEIMLFNPAWQALTCKGKSAVEFKLSFRVGYNLYTYTVKIMKGEIISETLFVNVSSEYDSKLTVTEWPIFQRSLYRYDPPPTARSDLNVLGPFTEIRVTFGHGSMEEKAKERIKYEAVRYHKLVLSVAQDSGDAYIDEARAFFGIKAE
jgi:hypothetical protein